MADGLVHRKEVSRRTSKRLFSTGRPAAVDKVEKEEHDKVVKTEVKRMRDCDEAEKQVLLAAFTSSFLDNPALQLTTHWFAQHDDEDVRMRNSTKYRGTPGTGRPAKSRNSATSRRGRYMRASPKPVSSLESCLRAQLQFDEEDKCMSQPGLRQVTSLDSDSPTMVFGVTRENIIARLPNMKKPKVAAVKASVDALLFSFGVGLGVMHTTAANDAEMARLRKRVEESEKLVQELQSSPAGDASHVHTNMAELEAQLEAELELMQLHSSGLDINEDLGEVLHDQLHISGLPGASDLEDEKNESRNGECVNWAVSPRELDKRLRLLLETQQEERMTRLEEQLEQTESELQAREEELKLWKERVRLLTDHLTVSGEADKQVVEREQSTSDDICDEFLKSVDALLDSDVSTNLEVEEGGVRKEVSSSSSSIWNWKYGSRFNAGAATPLEDDLRPVKTQLLNTPRKPEGGAASVVDKIRYWENVSNGRGQQQNNLQQQQQQEQSPVLLRLSCSEVSSSCDDADDDESWVSDVEERQVMKRIVEKSKKGSTLLRDVELMLAALECDSP